MVAKFTVRRYAAYVVILGAIVIEIYFRAGYGYALVFVSAAWQGLTIQYSEAAVSAAKKMPYLGRIYLSLLSTIFLIVLCLGLSVTSDAINSTFHSQWPGKTFLAILLFKVVSFGFGYVRLLIGNTEAER